jgi:hypothetical protein
VRHGSEVISTIQPSPAIKIQLAHEFAQVEAGFEYRIGVVDVVAVVAVTLLRLRYKNAESDAKQCTVAKIKAEVIAIRS